MENQHKHIKGYRDLTQEEIDLMNEGKALAEQCREYCDKVAAFESTEEDPDAPLIMRGCDKRWLNIGRTHLQQGFMAVIRAVAQPETF